MDVDYISQKSHVWYGMVWYGMESQPSKASFGRYRGLIDEVIRESRSP